MPRWSESLLKTRVDREVFDAPLDCREDERYRIEDLRFATEGVLDSKERLKATRERVKRSLARGPKTALVREIATALGEQLDEIERDLEFAQSRRGRFVLFVDDWAQGLHARLRADRRLDGVALGANPDQETIVATGAVAAPDDLVRLVQLLATDPPGVPLEYRVTVTP